MSLRIILLFLVSSTLSFPGSDMDMQEMLKIFSEMTDDNSVSLTDDNFRTLLNETSQPWFIFFYDVRSQKSVLSNPVWLIFGEDAKEANLQINLGKVDLATQEEVRNHFRINRPPAFLYIDQGYMYNYTGKTEMEDLMRVVTEKTYLQYDRKPFSPEVPQIGLPLKAKIYFVQNPAVVIGGIFVAVSVLLRIPGWLQKSKVKSKLE